jgi:chaperonin GroEL
MGAKEVCFRAQARERVGRGAAALADAVRVTLGPKAKCVLMQRKWGRPLACNDGVTIAREFELRDAVENLGVQMIRQAAERTSELVGDGTSTATVLAQAIFAEGLKNVTAGAGAAGIRSGLERGLRAALHALGALAKRVETKREKAQVATISAHNDAVIGQMVADALERVGSEGAITVEESRSMETRLDVVEGLQFENGYLSPYFVTDPEKMEALLENPHVLLVERKVTRLGELLPLLEQIAKGGRPLLIVAEDIEGEALATLVVNKLRGVLNSAAVRAPGFGDRRKAILQDLAILTGAKVVSEELGLVLEKIQISDLGQVRRAVIGRERTILVDGGGRPDAVAARCAELRRQIHENTSEYERQKLEERLARLAGGVAVIHVGAPSEAEMRNRKEAFEDALSATRAATSEGIVPGGGLALLRVADAVEAEVAQCTGDERTGVRILKKALEAPARQIAENSEADSGVVVHRMQHGIGNFGFDALTGEFVDLMEAGIVDPAKVVRVALENAVSVAGTLLFTEATLTEEASPRVSGRQESCSSETEEGL